MTFFVGLHQPSDAANLQRCFISVNRLRTRKSDFAVNDWIMDSGAFTEITTHGRYRDPVGVYAEQINRWGRCGNLLAAVAQDYMCEPFVLAKTGMSVALHQALTIERYDALRPLTRTYIMPVLQGYAPTDYLDHLRGYGDRLTEGAWVGVGSVCRRNSNPEAIHELLSGIKASRPDLRLHGFGLKFTSLADRRVSEMLHTSDSMAWSFAARYEGRNANDWKEAKAYCDKVTALLQAPAL